MVTSVVALLFIGGQISFVAAGIFHSQKKSLVTINILILFDCIQENNNFLFFVILNFNN